MRNAIESRWFWNRCTCCCRLESACRQWCSAVGPPPGWNSKQATVTRGNATTPHSLLGRWATGLFPSDLPVDVLQNAVFFVLFVCFLVYSPDTNSKEFPSHLNRFSLPSLLSLSLPPPALFPASFERSSTTHRTPVLNFKAAPDLFLLPRMLGLLWERGLGREGGGYGVAAWRQRFRAPVLHLSSLKACVCFARYEPRKQSRLSDRLLQNFAFC